MVTILPPERTSGDVFAKHIGQGIQGAMPQMYENQKFQRGMSAIDQFQSSMQPKLDANGQPIPQNPSEVLAHLMRAISANPSLERSGLGSEMVKLAQQGMYPGALGAGAGVAPSPTGTTAQAPQPSPVMQPAAPPLATEPTAETKKAKGLDSEANQSSN